jgi:hypothetical protein
MAKLLVSGDGATFTQVGTPLELINGDGAQRFGDLDPGNSGQAGGDGVIDLVPATGVYTRYTFDLDALLASAGISVGGTVYIDFHQLSFYKYNIVMFDNIHVYRTSGADQMPPQVVDVSVSGGDWTVPFTQYLTIGEMGTFSFSIPDGTGQLAPLPWGNINQLRIRFSEDVIVTAGSLSVYGVNTLDYTPTLASFTYEPSSRTAVWTFAAPFAADKLLLELDDTVTDRAGNSLDGEWLGTADAMPSGDGAEGGVFSYRINVLPGDLDRDGSVGMLDYSVVNNRVGTTANTQDYSALADYDGDGFTTQTDRMGVLTHIFQTLPSGEPSSLGVPGDVDGDNRVSLSDLLIVQRNLGRVGGVDRQSGDLNGDGQVDRTDLARVVQNFGRGALAAPSPSPAAEATAEAAAIIAGPVRPATSRLVARRGAVETAVDSAVTHDQIDLTAIRASRQLRREAALAASPATITRTIRR